MATTKVQRIMTQPINLIFRFLQNKSRIQIWLFEQKDLRIEGRIIGFDEYMNLVLDDAEEVFMIFKSLLPDQFRCPSWAGAVERRQSEQLQGQGLQQRGFGWPSDSHLSWQQAAVGGGGTALEIACETNVQPQQHK
ncbi:hypothetical protein Dimus_002814 [Dionaea muscipula]